MCIRDRFTYWSGDRKVTRKWRTKTGSGAVVAFCLFVCLFVFFRGMWWQTTLCLRWLLHHPTAYLLRSKMFMFHRWYISLEKYTRTGLFMCSFRDSSSLVTCMQASVEVAGTRIVTTRCTLIVNQRFCARVRMANVPLDWFTYRFSGDWKSLEKDVQKHAVEGQCHFLFFIFFFFVARGGLCLRWLLHHPTAWSPLI